MKNSIQNETAFFFLVCSKWEKTEEKNYYSNCSTEMIKKGEKMEKGSLYVINYPNWSFFAPFLNQRSERDFVQSEAQTIPGIETVIQFQLLSTIAAEYECWNVKKWNNLILNQRRKNLLNLPMSIQKKFHQKVSFAFFISPTRNISFLFPYVSPQNIFHRKSQ